MEGLEYNSTGSGALTFPCDCGYGCLTSVGLSLHLPKMERLSLSHLPWEV